jgi:enamine deaminase RidA (YjgF/YER057c/UK114 family)
METGILRLNQFEIKYSFLRDKCKNWLEFWYSISPEAPDEIESQIRTIEGAESELFKTFDIPCAAAAVKRFFLSDLISHQNTIREYVKRQETDFFLSIIEQPPASNVNVSLIGMCLNNITSKTRNGNFIWLDTSIGARHIFAEHLLDNDAEEDLNAEMQTTEIFAQLERGLAPLGATIEDNVLRTWIYASHLDADYPGIVRARTKFFDSINLTKETHYIASTGIQGGPGHRFACVFMDAYALTGIDKGAIRYIQAPEYLSPTHIYGVNFERATAVKVGNVHFLLISGTASIDRNGEIVHLGDVGKQTERTLLNITALLDSAGFKKEDFSSLIVYLRNSSDYTVVKSYVEEYAKSVPAIYVRASVCRPGWLVEIEATASRLRSSPICAGDAR